MKTPTPSIIRKPYDRHLRVTKSTSNESQVQQSMAAECDINKIMERHNKTGLVTHINPAIPQYGDFTQVQDYHSALNQVIDAQMAFDTLPASIRAKFQNDPGQFLDYMSDDENLDEKRKLGLLPPERPKKPQDDEKIEKDPPAPPAPQPDPDAVLNQS